MAQLQSIREQRYDQVYPTLDPLEVERVRWFGNVRSFAAGESLWTVGQVAPDFMVILTGKVAVTERDQFDIHKPIAVHGPGIFLGKLALLSSRPALVDAIARPLDNLVEEIDATRIILSALPIKGVLLALLHGSYSERSSKADLMRSLSRRNAGSLYNALRAFI
jgi:thioredoxin reductase (NADPH)